jgi:predicted phosphodiesterase
MFGSNYSKTKRPFGQPVSDAKGHPNFYKVPYAPPANLVLPIDTAIPGISAEILKAKKLVFHAVGDTGAVNGGNMQDMVADHMAAQFATAPTVGKPATLAPDAKNQPDPATGDPSFFYHLGDVVYFNGEEKDYGQQFYEPYQNYPAPIFAIAGNHDGDNHPSAKDDPQHLDHEQSLQAFFENFCSTQPTYESPYRQTMTQPYVYWTLTTPYATIIGLYSNVDGLLDPIGGRQQEAWYADQLRAADPNKCLLVAVHHPWYSLDVAHGGYPDILAAMDEAAQAANRYPDVVLTGHVHDYQRFTRTLPNGSEIPHIIAGSGGYAATEKATHKLQRDPEHGNAPITATFPTDVHGVTLEAYNECDGGFLRLTVDANTLECEYFAIPFDSPAKNTPFDSFTLDWKKKKITASSPGFAPYAKAYVPTHPKRRGAGKVPQGWPPTGPRRNRHT